MQLDKVIFGITAQSSSSSSSESSSGDEEEGSKVKDLPVLKRNETIKDKEEILSVKTEIKVEVPELKDKEKDIVVEEPVKRKRGRPSSLEKKCSPPKKVVKKLSLTKKASPEVIVAEKRPRGRPRKLVDSVNADNTPVKSLKTKVKSPKENGSSEGAKTTKHVSPSKTKSPVKETEVDENITSTTERLKDPDVVEDETVSSSCQDLVRSVKVQTKPISKKPSKNYINKVSPLTKIFCLELKTQFYFRFDPRWKLKNAKPLNN